MDSTSEPKILSIQCKYQMVYSIKSTVPGSVGWWGRVSQIPLEANQGKLVRSTEFW